MSAQKNSRAFQVRKAAEREQARYQQQVPEGFRFREILAFMQGADWERRRWMKHYAHSPELLARQPHTAVVQLRWVTKVIR